MDISAISGLPAAQTMFAPAAQAASGVSAPDPGAANGSAVEAAQVALLRQALDMERSMVNILA
jgi:hypothetical protein